MLEKAQSAVKEISGDFHKKTAETSGFFYTLILEQLGKAAHKYMHEGRYAKDVELDIAAVILSCLAYLNWIDRDASKAFAKALEKHKKKVASLKSKA